MITTDQKIEYERLKILASHAGISEEHFLLIANEVEEKAGRSLSWGAFDERLFEIRRLIVQKSS